MELPNNFRLRGSKCVIEREEENHPENENDKPVCLGTIKRGTVDVGENIVEMDVDQTDVTSGTIHRSDNERKSDDNGCEINQDLKTKMCTPTLDALHISASAETHGTAKLSEAYLPITTETSGWCQPTSETDQDVGETSPQGHGQQQPTLREGLLEGDPTSAVPGNAARLSLGGEDFDLSVSGVVPHNETVSMHEDNSKMVKRKSIKRRKFKKLRDKQRKRKKYGQRHRRENLFDDLWGVVGTYFLPALVNAVVFPASPRSSETPPNELPLPEPSQQPTPGEFILEGDATSRRTPSGPGPVAAADGQRVARSSAGELDSGGSFEGSEIQELGPVAAADGQRAAGSSAGELDSGGSFEGSEIQELGPVAAADGQRAAISSTGELDSGGSFEGSEIQELEPVAAVDGQGAARSSAGELDSGSFSGVSSEIQELENEYTKLERENEVMRETWICIICCENDRRIHFWPCCHLVCCVQCAFAFERCPVCREEITGMSRVEPLS